LNCIKQDRFIFTLNNNILTGQHIVILL